MKKFEDMLGNEEFVAKLNAAKTDEDVISLFDSYQVRLPGSGEAVLTEEDLDGVAGGGILAGILVYTIGGALTLIGGKHTIKRVKNEASCIFKGESAYPDNQFYTCR